MAYMRLGDLLISAGLITNEQLDRALNVQKTTHKRLGAVLIDEGIITEEELIETMQLQLGIDYIDPTKVNIPVELASVLPKSIAKRHSVVPVKLVRDELIIAMADPLNYVAIEDVRAATRKRVTPRIPSPSREYRPIESRRRPA